jgi:hypothetical protein
VAQEKANCTLPGSLNCYNFVPQVFASAFTASNNSPISSKKEMPKTF